MKGLEDWHFDTKTYVLPPKFEFSDLITYGVFEDIKNLRNSKITDSPFNRVDLELLADRPIRHITDLFGVIWPTVFGCLLKHPAGRC